MIRSGLSLLPLFAGLLLAACNGDDPAAGQPLSAAQQEIFANRWIAYDPVIGSGTTEPDWPFFYAPEVTFGAPGGVFGVASLGYDPASADSQGGTITLGLGEAGSGGTPHCAVNGTGADLAIYENPFITTDPQTRIRGTNNEVATVAVSEDGTAWYEFPPSIDSARNLIEQARYRNFAGVTPTAEGGDRFDLAEIIAAAGLSTDFRACYVRISDGGTRWPDYGNTQTDLHRSGADIDAVGALHSVAAPGLAP